MTRDPISTASPAAKATRRRSPESQARFRTELLDRAKEIYRTQGHAALTLRAVTQALGMSTMAFYSYFPSKQALVRHIWVDIFRGLLDALLAAGHGSRSPEETLRAHVVAFLRYWEQHADHYRMVYRAESAAPGEDEPDIASDPVYEQMLGLSRERVVACAGGKALPEADIRLINGAMTAKMLGYLQLRLGMSRSKVADDPAFRPMLVDDIVEGVMRAAASAAARRA